MTAAGLHLELFPEEELDDATRRLAEAELADAPRRLAAAQIGRAGRALPDGEIKRAGRALPDELERAGRAPIDGDRAREAWRLGRVGRALLEEHPENIHPQENIQRADVSAPRQTQTREAPNGQNDDDEVTGRDGLDAHTRASAAEARAKARAAIQDAQRRARYANADQQTGDDHGQVRA